jgi:7-keto-8-aminopelargonate synthetase-like enzyme
VQENIAYFDSLIPTENARNGLPIRVIQLKEPNIAVESSGEMLRRGFYTSAVYFPIVPRGRAGLRVMMRADLHRSEIEQFWAAVADLRA